jgi:hypothetical protein
VNLHKREQFMFGDQWLATQWPASAGSSLQWLTAAVMLASGLFLSACDSSEPRSGETDYEEDASTGGKANATTGSKKDAGSSDNGDASQGTATGNAQEGAKCGDKTCDELAACKDDKCACPEGYEDVKGDGTECKDIDECKERTAECSRGASCKNEPGSYKCECSGPAYEQDGEDCKCAEGYERNEDGFCAGDDGKACEDGIDCKNGNCEGKICCAVSCGEPGECQVTDGATCSEDGKSCIYPRAEDGASCDDSKACTKDGTCKEGKCQESKEATNCNDGNPCTDDSCEEPTGCRNANNTATCDDGTSCTNEDKCNAGQCKGTEKDCSAEADVCNVGACNRESGECRKEPRTTSVTCDDSNSCTSNDSCQNGTCTGASACGTNSTGCEAGGEGEPNMCTCSNDFVSYEGRCVPMNDECQRENPCSADADCIDPSTTDGDLTCTCKPGFSGNGVDCVATDPCATNPCGTGGTCTNTGNGEYSCECSGGTREVGGKCGCDLSGTFGVKSTQTISWRDVDQFVEDGVVQTATFAMHRHSYDAEGNLQVEIVECGGSVFDLCSVPFPPFLGAEAYGQYSPETIWGGETMPRTTINVSLPDSQPGAAFKTAEFAMLNGIQLDDPMGEWPSDRRQIAGASESEGTPVNGATWLDSDNDGSLALTTYGVGPEGEPQDGVPPEPPIEYGTRSRECPRSSDGERYPYAYPPAIPNGSLSVQRIKRFFTAQRARLAYDGKIDSCDVITGAVTGPDNGQLKLDTRVAGCVRVNGSGESACAAGAVDFLDQQPQTQNLSDTKFTIKRLADGVTCADVRAASY